MELKDRHNLSIITVEKSLNGGQNTAYFIHVMVE